MAAPRSDALVFFGATGDLAHKKIFPALQAMVRRGQLDVPVVGVAKAGWTLEQLTRARPRQPRAARRRRRRGAVREARGAAPLRRRRLRRPGDVRGAAQGAGRRPRGPLHYLAIPPSLFATVVAGARRRRAAPTNARVVVEKPFGRDLASARGAQRDAARGLPRGVDLPHRPLPRQGAGAEPPLLPLRQHLPRADLEPPLRRERADHHGRELRRAGARRASTTRPARSATSSRTTCCRSWASSRWSRRRARTTSRSATSR